MNFILFLLAVIGMTHILVDGSIFKPVRDWLKTLLPSSFYTLFECYMCMGFWCGLFLGFFMLSHDVCHVFAAGCAGSFLANFGSILLNYFLARSIVDLDE